MSSARCAARTVLAAASGCFPVDRRASVWACRWTGTAVPATVTRVTIGPGRWCARSGPLSTTGSCRPSPHRQGETTSADQAAHGDGARIGSLVLGRVASCRLAPALTQQASTTMRALPRRTRIKTPVQHLVVTHAQHAARYPRQTTATCTHRLTPARYHSLPLLPEQLANPRNANRCGLWASDMKSPTLECWRTGGLFVRPVIDDDADVDVGHRPTRACRR